MAGFRTFATGEVLSAANVNNFLMKQSVMVFADAAARTAALGAEVAEGMLTYNEDTAQLEVFDGTNFVGAAGGGFDDVEVITVTNATFSVPALGSPIVKVTVIGAGGGGANSPAGGNGGTTSFGSFASASGGTGGRPFGSESGEDASAGLSAGNGGMAGGTIFVTSGFTFHREGQPGNGGSVTVAYVDLTSVSTVNVTIGAGGSAGGNGSAGGRGEVILEFKAA